MDINYSAEPTVARFHASDAFVRGIRGPVGSGKSTGCCVEIFSRGIRQRPLKDGTKRTRWAVIRSTYRELLDTTVKTWLDWFPEDAFGPFNRNSMTHAIRYGDADIEVMFRALDRPRDIKKLLSLELTGGWINEARETPFGIVEALIDRIGRYPAVRDGGPTWEGLLMDTNSMDDDHWWYRLAEEEKPHGWEFYNQPGGLIEVTDGDFQPNPKAENLQNLPKNYYEIRKAGKSKDHARIYYCNQYGFVADGMPIIPEYNDTIHFNEKITEPVPGRPIGIGLDFGLTPAAVFGQQLTFGKYIWFDEVVTENMGAKRFAELLAPKMRYDYPGFDFEIWGDPAGDDRAQTDEDTVFNVLNNNGVPAIKAPTNDFTIRREAIANPLARIVDGEPALQIGPKCKITRKGLAGGYCYRRVQASGLDERYHNVPDKNKYSHPVEAGGYLMCGLGEGDTVVGHHRRQGDEVKSRFAQLKRIKGMMK